MRHLKVFTLCLAALAVHGAAWAEIYETTDAQGNPEFTDSPPNPDAQAINLQQTNIIDAPPEAPQQVSAPQSVVEEQAPQQENRTVIIHDGDDNLGDVYDEELRRERAFERTDPAAPREIGDASSQMPRQVGDSDAQMPDEVGDFDAPVVQQPDAADRQVIREADDAHVQRRITHPNHR